jgi:hypothetical protein
MPFSLRPRRFHSAAVTFTLIAFVASAQDTEENPITQFEIETFPIDCPRAEIIEDRLLKGACSNEMVTLRYQWEGAEYWALRDENWDTVFEMIANAEDPLQDLLEDEFIKGINLLYIPSGRGRKEALYRLPASPGFCQLGNVPVDNEDPNLTETIQGWRCFMPDWSAAIAGFGRGGIYTVDAIFNQPIASQKALRHHFAMLGLYLRSY